MSGRARRFGSLFVGAALLLGGCAGRGSGMRLSPGTTPDLARLLESQPASSTRAEDATSAALMALGPPGLRALCALLGSPLEDDDLAARYAMAGLRRWVTRPGAAAERTLFADALGARLATAADASARAFVIELLGGVGDAISVEAIAGLLGDGELGDPAARALASIGGDAASAAVERALERGPVSADLLLAAGRLGAVGAERRLIAALSGDVGPHADAAAEALALLGAAPMAGPALFGAATVATDERRQRLAALALDWAVRAGSTEGSAATARAIRSLAAEDGDAALAGAAQRVLQGQLDAAVAASPTVEEGFEPLFDGSSLDGWMGATDAYEARDGLLVSVSGGQGNLYTERQFSDFVLRFEFRLTPGANNGLGIRAPPRGDAAYVGIELQILDDGAWAHRDLRPWQYHGSVYGVAAARRGAQRPPGEWNAQEVTVHGRRIAVVLNGSTILDVDLDEMSAAGPVDGRDHPGLARARGHIGFLGHGAYVEFRNIRIRRIEASALLDHPFQGLVAGAAAQRLALR